jgi:hypothetical protein
MVMELWMMAVGLFFMVGSFFMNSVGAAFAKRGVAPATLAHKIAFCALGLIVFVEGALTLWETWQAKGAPAP